VKKNRILLISLAVVLAVSVGLGSCVPAAKPDAIKIGAVRSLSGPLEVIGNFACGPVMELWEQAVNADGGIYVKEYDKNLTVDIEIRDDMSDNTTMTNHLTDMVTNGTYDFVLPPVGTEFLQTAAEICSDNEYVLIGAEYGCGLTIQNTLNQYPYFFNILNYSTRNQMEKLFEILRDWQDRSVDPATTPINVYIIYNANLHGNEYKDAFVAEAAKYGGNFTIVNAVPVEPLGTNVNDQLYEAVSLNTNLFCSFTYPHTSLATIATAAELDINFDAMLVGPGCNFEYTLLPSGHWLGTGLGGDLMQEVMGFGAWNEYSPAAAGVVEALINYLTDVDWLELERGRYSVDWWGALTYYAGLQCLQQAIERAGTLDNDDVRAELAAAWPGSPTNPPFDTVLGDVWFTDANGDQVVAGATGGLLAKECYAGQIGQWQHVTETNCWLPDGVTGTARAKPYGIADDAIEWWIFEVIDLGDNQTAPGIYPKQNWPE